MLKPTYVDGRFFVSPILGCRGACSYCYLHLHDYARPRKNEISIEEIRNTASMCPDFIFGKNGTIISVGAWGDIFPHESPDLIEHSVSMITDLLQWGNPVQIMSKYVLPDQYINKIVDSVRYHGQLLYSTTITSIHDWRQIEPLTSDPIGRLETCLRFHKCGVPTNVLLKPYFPEVTGTELESIADLMLKYEIDYCTIGILYWDEKIMDRILQNPFLSKKICFSKESDDHYLDCDGYQKIHSDSVSSLLDSVHFLRTKGICAFLKSSCVNSNILKTVNPSGYFIQDSEFCIDCGNCRVLIPTD